MVKTSPSSTLIFYKWKVCHQVLSETVGQKLVKIVQRVVQKAPGIPSKVCTKSANHTSPKTNISPEKCWLEDYIRPFSSDMFIFGGINMGSGSMTRNRFYL